MPKARSSKERAEADLKNQDPVIFGQSALQHVVGVQLLNDSTVRLYIRPPSRTHATEELASVTSTDVEFFPFFFLSSPTLIQGFSQKHWMKELAGSNFFRYLVAFQRWNEMWEAVRHVMFTYNRTALRKANHYSDIEPLLLRPDPLTQYLLQSGVTLFKGLTFEDVHRVQIRIATHSRQGKPSDPRRTEDRIIAAVLTDSTGWERTFDGRKLSEPDVLRGILSAVGDRNPDFIEGHNLFDFILPYLLHRAEMHAIELTLGRDGSALKSFSPRGTPLETPIEHSIYEVAGRHLIDTRVLAHTYATSRRPLEHFGLRTVMHHLGLPSEQEPSHRGVRARTEVAPPEPVESLLPRLTAACHDIRSLSAHLTPSLFFQSSIVPFSFDALTRSGSAAKIEVLMLRDYVRQKHSVPKPQTGTQQTGGYTDIFITGILPHVLSVDIESLYPSIMLTQGIRPASDELGTFLRLLEALTSTRLEAKRGMKEAGDSPVARSLDTFQSSLKILINSFYGYLGYARGLFNDYEQADRVTTGGQELLRRIIHEVELHNGRVIEADTDGLYFLPPDNVRGEAQEDVFVRKLSSVLPAGINLVLAGRYQKMLSYRKKNYALLDNDNRLTIRGSSLISRSMERFTREYVRMCINYLLQEDLEALHKLYGGLAQDITHHRWDVYDFCRTETIRESLDRYEASLREGNRKPSAAYEVAKRAGLLLKAGDRISYYVTGSMASVKISDNAKLAEDWQPHFPDENTAYYLERLVESSRKFDVFFSKPDFEKVFSAEDLFGFDATQIRIVTESTVPPDRLPPPEDDSDDLGIWLDESG